MPSGRRSRVVSSGCVGALWLEDTTRTSVPSSCGRICACTRQVLGRCCVAVVFEGVSVCVCFHFCSVFPSCYFFPFSSLHEVPKSETSHEVQHVVRFTKSKQRNMQIKVFLVVQQLQRSKCQQRKKGSKCRSNEIYRNHVSWPALT